MCILYVSTRVNVCGGGGWSVRLGIGFGNHCVTLQENRTFSQCPTLYGLTHQQFLLWEESGPWGSRNEIYDITRTTGGDTEHSAT